MGIVAKTVQFFHNPPPPLYAHNLQHKMIKPAFYRLKIAKSVKNHIYYNTVTSKAEIVVQI